MSAPPKISHRVPLGRCCFIPGDLLLGEEDRRREEIVMVREDRNPPPAVCGGGNIVDGSFIFLDEGDRPEEEIATARGDLGESGGGDEGAPSVGVVTEGGAAGTSDCGGRQSGGGVGGSAGMDRARQPSATWKNRKMRSQPSEKSGAAKCCTDCGARQSWMWRGGPDGPKTLCSACGIYGEANGRESPLEEFLREMRAKAAKSAACVSDEVVEAAAILMAISSAQTL